jgi:hypothetical protein
MVFRQTIANHFMSKDANETGKSRNRDVINYQNTVSWSALHKFAISSRSLKKLESNDQMLQYKPAIKHQKDYMEVDHIT